MLRDENTGLADEETGRAIGAQLCAEAADLRVPPDLIAAVRHRNGRRTAAVRGGIAAAGAAVLAAVGLALTAVAGSAAPGNLSASRTGTSHRPAGPAVADRTIELDGYEVKLPDNLSVKRVGAGYLVGSHAVGYFTIFLERGKNVGPKLARAHGLTLQRVRAGTRSAWWVGTDKGGELWVHLAGMRPTEFLVAKARGANEGAALTFAEGLAVTHLPVVHVSCSASCA